MHVARAGFRHAVLAGLVVACFVLTYLGASVATKSAATRRLSADTSSLIVADYSRDDIGTTLPRLGAGVIEAAASDEAALHAIPPVVPADAKGPRGATPAPGNTATPSGALGPGPQSPTASPTAGDRTPPATPTPTPQGTGTPPGEFGPVPAFTPPGSASQPTPVTPTATPSVGPSATPTPPSGGNGGGKTSTPGAGGNGGGNTNIPGAGGNGGGNTNTPGAGGNGNGNGSTSTPGAGGNGGGNTNTPSAGGNGGGNGNGNGNGNGGQPTAKGGKP